MSLWRCQSGATAIEYGLIVGLIFLVIVTGVTALAGANGGLYATFNQVIAALKG